MFSATFLNAILIIIWANAVLWLAAIFWTRRQFAELKPLPVKELSLSNNFPRVSILLPARNEEHRILTACVDSLLAQDYENLEIIAVNDRSTDCTGEILRDSARRNDKLRVIEGVELPVGWLGKPFAMRQAFEQSNGEWILTTDADIRFAPAAVSTAIARALEKDADVLCLIPFVSCETFWERLFMPLFNWFRMLAMPPVRVNDSRFKEALGVGNFFLVKRDALEKIDVFDKLRGEVAEDLRLAQILKTNGARFRLDYAPDLLETRMYAGLREIWHGFTKNFFAASNSSLVNAIFGVISITLQGALPLVAAIICLSIWIYTAQNVLLWLFAPFAAIYVLQSILFARVFAEYRQPKIYAVFAPLGLALFAAILLNSTVKVVSGRGVRWKDRTIQ